MVGLTGVTLDSVTSASLLMAVDGPLRNDVVSCSIVSRCSARAILASLVFRCLGTGTKQNLVGTAADFSVRFVGANSGRIALTKSSLVKCSLRTRAFLSAIGGFSNRSLLSHYIVTRGILHIKFTQFKQLTCFSNRGLLSDKQWKLIPDKDL